MATTGTWILIAVIAFTMFLQGKAIKCWTCGSATQRECGDEPETDKMTEVDSCKYCYKTKSSDTFGFHSMDRGCFTDDEVNAKGLSEVKLGCTTCKECGTTAAACLCDSDNCNHGNTVLISLLTMVFALISFRLLQ